MAEFVDFDCFPCARWQPSEEFHWGEIVQHGGVVYVCGAGRTTYEPGMSSAWVRIGLLEHYPTTARRLQAARRALGPSDVKPTSFSLIRM